MPLKSTITKAGMAKKQGKSPSTQAGAFVEEEIKSIRKGRHGARSARQAIAIGLSKARRAGVDLKPPEKGTVAEKTRKSAEGSYKKGQAHEPVSATRSAAREKALKKEPETAASHEALSRQAKAAARKRTAADRSRAAKKAARTRKRTAMNT
ncbi:DNA-binding protein [Niabella beijingensis]|uniref:DNA-binding protein n=1 Tax=Niabella beijingensis TaxID=2872700 RepID=UPI001CC0B928|nr:DNA-binding protein [Niabella beijingensis]MBZ4190926.1 DNA-binding protein [Niabella beijingensis]